MKSYIPTFDWNNGQEVSPFEWLDEEDRVMVGRGKIVGIAIRRGNKDER